MSPPQTIDLVQRIGNGEVSGIRPFDISLKQLVVGLLRGSCEMKEMIWAVLQGDNQRKH